MVLFDQERGLRGMFDKLFVFDGKELIHLSLNKNCAVIKIFVNIPKKILNIDLQRPSERLGLDVLFL